MLDGSKTEILRVVSNFGFEGSTILAEEFSELELDDVPSHKTNTHSSWNRVYSNNSSVIGTSLNKMNFFWIQSHLSHLKYRFTLVSRNILRINHRLSCGLLVEDHTAENMFPWLVNETAERVKRDVVFVWEE